jgi:RND family efflux transporter MFP subunit
MKYHVLTIALAINISLLLTACGDKENNNAAQQQAPQAVAVGVTTVQKGSAVYYDEYPATVTALIEVEIRPQVSGYITGIHFKDGQHVSKGQKLYSIDQQQYRGTYEQAIANLNVAKANMARAQQDAERYQQLAEQDAIARQTLEHALADLNTARSQVAAQQANVSAVGTNLRYSTIFAPVSGTIGISQVKVGASVSPGSTVLNTISDDDPMAVDFQVDEKSIARFATILQQGTNPKDSIFTIVLPDGSVYPVPGQLSVVDRAVDPQTGTIRVRLSFANKSNILRPGMSCNVRVKNNTGTEQILIPYAAVTEQMGEYFVYVVGDSSKVTQRKVTLGQRLQEDVIVKEGVQTNDVIVTTGIQKLREGAVVKASADTTGKK